jgi:hypothetical protein
LLQGVALAVRPNKLPENGWLGSAQAGSAMAKHAALTGF